MLLNRYVIESRCKRTHWDVEWSDDEDSNLLKGIYEYGIGSWEAIKMDPQFDLHDKVRKSYLNLIFGMNS